jgi:hypothetical protein
VPIDDINAVSVAALSYVQSTAARITAVHITDNVEEGERVKSRFKDTFPGMSLLIIDSPYRAFVAPMLAYIETLQEGEPGVPVAIVLPRFIVRHWWERFLHNQDVLRLRKHLMKRKNVRVLDFAYQLD